MRNIINQCHVLTVWLFLLHGQQRDFQFMAELIGIRQRFLGALTFDC